MSKRLINAHISDVHFGCMPTDRLIKELRSEFLYKLKMLPRVDILFIQGDVYNHELSLNSKDAKASLEFLDEVTDICKCVRAIKGTRNHDHEQLRNLKFLDKKVDFRIIETVQIEYIKGCKILYLPEEYMEDPDEYYEDYFNVEDDTYDYIIGHGMIDKMAFNNYNSEKHIKTAPVYSSKQLSRICAGPVSLGHVHSAYHWRNIFYTGSFTRWCQGEELPKGFAITIYNPDTQNYILIPVRNRAARTYIKRNFTRKLEKYTLDELIEIIRWKQRKHSIFMLEIVFIKTKNTEAKIMAIKNAFMRNKHIKITILNDNDNTNTFEEIFNNTDDEYDFLFEDISKYEKLSRFIKLENNSVISPERINELVNTDIIKIIKRREETI